MNPQQLLIFSPFVAVLYVLFALIQALRGKRQGTFAAILAFFAAALSMVAFVVTSEALARAQLERLMLLNAIIAFVASLLILLIERRKKDRDPSRSYGIIGVGLAILLALGTYITPLLANAVPSNGSGTALSRGDTTLQTISALTPGASTTDLASILSAQTGLSTADLTTQLNNGSSLAQLVSAHNGSLPTVTAAVKSTLDTMVASGARSAQFLTRLGSDTSAIADQIVQGQLPAQQQGRVIELLTTSGTSTQGAFQPQDNGTPGAGGSGGFQPPVNGTPGAGGSGFQPQGNGTPGAGGSGGFQPPALATDQAAPQALPTIAASASTGSDTVASVLTAQTGLSTDDLTTQLTAGSTIAQLVSAHNGDVSAVSAAIKTALDDMIAAGGRAAGLLSRMGTDTATVTDQIVQGQLPAQQQQFVVSFLITGTLPQFGGANNGTGSGGSVPPQVTPNAPVNQSVSANNNPPGSGGSVPGTGSGSAPVDPPAVEPTNTPVPVTPPPTSSIERPTRIVFPTSTPTPEAAAATDEAASTSGSSPSANSTTVGAPGTCTLVTNFNLNLRDKPGKDGIVMLSIPMGTTVTSDARTADGWFSVSYDGHDGWVSGQYAGQSDGCASLPAK